MYPMSRSCGETRIPDLVSNQVLDRNWILPSSGHSSPATDRRMVVLPDPDGPNKINTVEASTA